MRETYENVKGAPAAVGPYSIAVSVGDLLYTSGQLPIDPDTGRLIGDTVGKQARQALENLKSIVENLGSDINSIIKVNVYLTNMGRFEEFNNVYAEFFQDSYPARSCVEVSNLPKGAQIEIECVALRR